MSQPEPFESSFEENLYRQRQEKLEAIRALGVQGGLTAAESIYPNRFPAADEPVQLSGIPALLAQYDDPQSPVSTEKLEADPPTVAVAGRLMSLRVQGKAGFAHLQGGGKRLQIYIRKDDVGDLAFALYKLLDLGDHIGVRGHLMRTRTGELTLKATPLPNAAGQPQPAISFLAKSMLALPDKYHGLEDVELRYRQRYVDLIMNSGTLAKAETAQVAVPETPQIAVLAGTPSSRPEAGSAAAERPLYSSAAPQTPPETAATTASAPPNEEPNDAPFNVRAVFEKRAGILRALRKFFDTRGYIEVETPMLHTVAGGAAAKPFSTHHNALDLDLSLRIAPELFLKRLVVGGLDRVYEINRNFRNEGVSTKHNPEFTMLEFYQAYSNYHDLMYLTQELIEFVALEVNGTTETLFNSNLIDLKAQNWTKLSMREAIVKFWPEGFGAPPADADFLSEKTFADFLTNSLVTLQSEYPQIGTPSAEVQGVDIERHRYRRSLLTIFNGHRTLLNGDRTEAVSATTRVLGLPSQQGPILVQPEPVGKAIAGVFEALAEPHLIQPTIIYDFPLAVSPLSKVKPDEPDWVERFEFYIGGFEIGNAFSELNDPVDQRQRFEAQVADKDPESMAAVDEDYVRALGYGLPPTAGEGIGIDRLTMILTGSRSIRDVILFPLMRPRPAANEEAPAQSAVPSPS